MLSSFLSHRRRYNNKEVMHCDATFRRTVTALGYRGPWYCSTGIEVVEMRSRLECLRVLYDLL